MRLKAESVSTDCVILYRGWKIDVHFFTYPDVDVDKVMSSFHYSRT